MASLAEFEGRIIHERLLKGKRQKAAQGGYTGGWLPYELRRDAHGQVAVVPAKSEPSGKSGNGTAEAKASAGSPPT